MAEPPPERLFRDDAGAAVERAARLEEDNRRLRAELARLQRQGAVPTVRTRRPPQGFAVAVGVAGATLGVALVMLRMPPPRHEARPPAVVTARRVPPRVRPPVVVAPRASTSSCASTYVDAYGDTRLEPRCAGR